MIESMPGKSTLESTAVKNGMVNWRYMLTNKNGAGNKQNNNMVVLAWTSLSNLDWRSRKSL